VVGSIPDQEFNNLAKKIISIAKELYDKKGFANEGSYEQRVVKYEERSNPLLTFIDKYCEESPDDLLFGKFCEVFNEFCIKHRMRPLTNKQISKSLREEGYVVKVKHNDYDEKRTTAFYLFNMDIKDIKDIQYKVQNTYREIDLKSHIQDILDIHNHSNNSFVIPFNTKTQSWQPCCHPKGQDGICGKSPCNDLEGLYYCQEHFESVQLDKSKEEKIIDLRQSNEVQK
jgi:hypothetical protein